MTSALGSITVSGLLGGTAGQIDTDSLIASLMKAEAIPQNQLKDQLSAQQTVLAAYQSVNTRMTALQTAARAVTDPATWNATSATSSSPAVVASGSASATPGSTTFDVLRLATAQVSTIAADATGSVVGTTAAGITITAADGTAHQISLTSGAAEDVAAAINGAGIGVRAAVVRTDGGLVLQLSARSTGTANAFTATGFDAPATTIVAAQDARIGVGDPAAGGYTISSSSNTFTDGIPGVTFSVGAVATGVTVTVTSDTTSITSAVKAMVDAANAASSTIASLSGKGAPLQARSDVRSIAMGLGSAVSGGTDAGGSLRAVGIDLDSHGVISFDADAFTAAFAADPTGTTAAVSGSLATRFGQAADAAIAPVTGSVTQAIADTNGRSDDLNKQIDGWTSRLSDIQTRLQLKYAAMQTMLAKLQSQSTYLTSMLKSLSPNSDTKS